MMMSRRLQGWSPCRPGLPGIGAQIPGRLAPARTGLVAGGLLLAFAAGPVGAQGPWGLVLFVDPFPSPYASDWETNPNISTLTVINPTGVEQDVRIVYQVANRQGQVLASGHSDPLGIPPGAPTILTSILDIAGTSTRDGGTWDQMSRTGRLPEGQYTACVSMAGSNGLVLGEGCETFTIIYPDPPVLLAPAAGEAVTSQAPFFQWTPVTVPPAYPAQYVLQVAEVLPNQTPEEALGSTIVHFQQPDLTVTNLQYPASAQPFEVGKYYAWRVVVIDQTGFPPTANGGLSEIRTFRFDDGTDPGQRMEVTLSLANSFDEVTGTGTSAWAPNTVDVSDICTGLSASTAGAVGIATAMPLGARRFNGEPAVFWRGQDDRWWIVTQKSTGNQRGVLIGGDCAPELAKDGSKARVRYVVSRDTSLQRRLNERLIPTVNRPEVGAAGALVDSVFGMVVIAIGQHTVEAPPGFTEAEEFLGGRTFEVATGLNLFVELSLDQWDLWPWFQSLGFTQKKVTLTGFLGWDASWNIGGAIGQTAGVDVSTERKFLTLRFEFPKRTSVQTTNPAPGANAAPTTEQTKWWREMGLSLEFTVGDSTGRGFSLDGHRNLKRDPGYSLEFITRLKHTIVVNEDVSLVGYIGLDLAYEGSRGPGRAMLDRWDWLRGKRQTWHNWLSDKSGALAKLRAAIDKKVNLTVDESTILDLENDLDFMFGYGVEGRVSALWGGDDRAVRVDGVALDFKYRRTEKRLTAALSLTLGVAGADEVVKLGASKVFLMGTKPDTSLLRIEELPKLEALSRAVAAVPDGTTMPDCGSNRDHDHPVCVAYRELAMHHKMISDAGNPSWRIRLSAGHMSLGSFVDLLRPWAQSLGDLIRGTP